MWVGQRSSNGGRLHSGAGSSTREWPFDLSQRQPALNYAHIRAYHTLTGISTFSPLLAAPLVTLPTVSEAHCLRRSTYYGSQFTALAQNSSSFASKLDRTQNISGLSNISWVQWSHSPIFLHIHSFGLPSVLSELLVLQHIAFITPYDLSPCAREFSVTTFSFPITQLVDLIPKSLLEYIIYKH